MPELFRVIYTSRAQEPLQIEQILLESTRWNAGHGITGGLVMLEGTFMQYLEGSETDVDGIFRKIARDPRHRAVKVLEQRKVQKRMFGEWAMALLSWNDETRMIFHSFSPGARLDLYENDPSTAAPMFRAWAATSQWKTGVLDFESPVLRQPRSLPPESPGNS